LAVKRFLIFDFGASNGRASVARFDGNKFEIETIHRFENIPVYATEILYWDVLRLYNDLKIGILKATSKYKDIISLGIDTWGVDFGFIDKNGKLISNLEHYRDKRRFEITENFFKVISRKELFNLTGGLILPGISSIFHLYDLKIRKATQYTNAYKFLMLPDLFNYFLTGNTFNEYTEATTSIMVNQATRRWEDRIFEKTGFPKELFCELIEPGTVVGILQENVIEELNINPIKVVAPATHDTASAIAGFPIVDKKVKENTLLVSLGTWGIIIKETSKPIINDLVYELGFANEGGVEGLNMLAINITGLWIIQQCMIQWRKEMGENFDWKDIDNLYPKAQEFKSYIDVDDQIFSQVSTDMRQTIINYCRDKNQNIPENIGQIARTLYENLIFKIKSKINAMERIVNNKIDSIHIVGGGSRNKLFCQWLADSTGLKVASGPAETTSIGNLLMQLKAEGEINSLEEGRQISYNSSEILIYEPNDSMRQTWESHYEKYMKFISS